MVTNKTWKVDAIKHIPMDDAVNEGPHAVGARIAQHSKGRCRFPFLASSMRMNDNFAICDELPPMMGVSLDQTWLNYKSVLPRTGVNKKAFLDRVYKLSAILDFTKRDGDDEDEDSDEDGDSSSGDDDDDDGPPGLDSDPDEAGDGPRGDKPGRNEAGGDGHGDPDHDAGAADGAGPPTSGAPGPGGPGLGGDGSNDGPGGNAALRATILKRSNDSKLMHQWLVAALPVGAYISLPHCEQEENVVVQILAAPEKQIVVKSYANRSKKDAVSEEFEVQPLEKWLGTHVLPHEMEVFIVADPLQLNLVNITGCDPEVRHDILRWERKRSDLESCANLSNGTPVMPSMALSNKNVPILCLLDRLIEDKWRGEARKVKHSPGSELVYDSRNPLKHREYYQALVVINDLFAMGAQPFASTECSKFYRLLRTHPSLAAPGMKAETCVSLLENTEARPARLPKLDEPAPKRQRRARAVESEEDVAPDTGARASSDPPPPPHPPREPSPSKDSETSSGSSLEVAPDNRAQRPKVPKEILGQTVALKWHKPQRKWGMEVACLAHRDCNKFRTLGLQREQFGDLEAEAFLGFGSMALEFRPPPGRASR